MNIYQELVDFIGSQQKTALLLKVAQSSVNAWVKGKTKMSALVAIRAESVTGGKFKAEDLCPEIKQAKAA